MEISGVRSNEVQAREMATLLISSFTALILSLLYVSLLCTQRQNCSLEDDVLVVVICNHTWNVGPQIDVILAPIVEFEPITAIELRAIHFPNGRLSADWYNGRIDIYEIFIDLENVSVIESNAFNSNAFRTVDILKLTFKQMTEIMSGAFNSLPDLGMLILRSTDSATYFCNPSENLLAAVRTRIEVVVVFNFTDTFNSLFGNIRLPLLLHVAITNPPNKYIPRFLSPHNFSSFTIVQILTLNNCGIESISEHTFDTIGHTLRILDLSHNRIKHLSLDIFWIFINSRYRERQTEIANYKMFYFQDNLVECGCEFYEVRNVTAISFHIQNENFTCNSGGNTATTKLDSVCEGNQIINVNRWSLDHPNIDVFAYPSFNMHFNHLAKTVSVNQLKHRQYRLWIQNFNDPELKRKQKCPNRGWILQSVHCLILANVTEVIKVNTYLKKSELSQYCVIYLMYSQPIWPLHCITVRHLLNEDLEKWNIALPGAAALFGLTLGIFVLCVQEFGRVNKSIELEVEANEYQDGSICSEKSQVLIKSDEHIITGAESNIDRADHVENLSIGSNDYVEMIYSSTLSSQNREAEC